MSQKGFSKSYLDSWLRRTRRELARSGRLSELVFILANEDSVSPIIWRKRLQGILDGEEEPKFELLTKIDSILAHPADAADKISNQVDLLM